MNPARRATTEIILRNRPRGLIGHIRMVLLQPILFFRILSVPNPESRMWLWAALAIVFVLGAGAVRQAELRAVGANLPAVDVGAPPIDAPPGDLGGGGVSPVPGGDFGGGIPPGVQPPSIDQGEAGTTNTAEVSTTLTTGMIGVSGLVFSWFGLMIILSLVSLARGLPPSFGTNFQVAIWASAPLLIMTLLQFAYYAAGGKIGADGLVGLLSAIPNYETFSPFVRDVLYSLFSRFTVFWLWMLILIYLGSRFALRGSRMVSVFVVVVWAIILVMLPVASGQSQAPKPAIPAPLSLPDAAPPLEVTPLG